MKIRFVCNAVKWFDKINGNTYHSVRVTRCKDGKVIYGSFRYGYGDSYSQTTLEIMFGNKWIPKRYKNSLYRWERENDYPINYNLHQGLKRECIANGKEVF